MGSPKGTFDKIFLLPPGERGATGATNGGRWVIRTQMRGGQVTLAKEKPMGMRRLGSIGIFLRYNQWLF